MVTISVKSHTKPDGTLEVTVATGLPETDVDVLVVVQPRGEDEGANNRWAPGFIDQTYGSFQDDPLTLQPAGDFEVREEFE
ncbi:MAG: hypothetical protein HYR60_01610 [Acidobacteria bacterium]|nr:hypothetical protein [Acidobacteriota bacterium]